MVLKFYLTYAESSVTSIVWETGKDNDINLPILTEFCKMSLLTSGTFKDMTRHHMLLLYHHLQGQSLTVFYD